jgi:hypothetical protein
MFQEVGSYVINDGFALKMAKKTAKRLSRQPFTITFTTLV